MYGYIRQGRRTALTRETIGGVPFWVLTAGPAAAPGRPPPAAADGAVRRENGGIRGRCVAGRGSKIRHPAAAGAGPAALQAGGAAGLRMSPGLAGPGGAIAHRGGRRGGPARRAGAGPAGAVRGAGALRPDGTGAMAAGAVRSGGRVLRPYAGGDGASGPRTGEAGCGSVPGTGLRRAPAGDLRGAGAGTVAGDGAAAGGADRSGAMGAIRNSCGFGDFPRLTGGGKLTIMQRDILCVFCL